MITAVTSIRAVHKKKNTSTKAYIKKIVEYMTDSEKTENRTLVSSYMCDPDIADVQFTVSKQQYLRNTGRTQKSDVLAYTVLQSFFLDEVEPEKVNEIGRKLAEELTKGEHAFIVTTHVNTDNIHNHIIWNSTNINCDGKWVDVKRSGKDVARASDLLCRQNRLSVIEERRSRKEYSSYGAWKKENDYEDKKPSLRKKLQWAIDEVLELKPKSLEEFLSAMKNLGYENKIGEHIAFRFKGNKKFLRLRSLDEEYSQENILKKLEEFADGEVGHLKKYEDEVDTNIFDGNYNTPTKSEIENQTYLSSSQKDLSFDETYYIEETQEDNNIYSTKNLDKCKDEQQNLFSLSGLKNMKEEVREKSKPIENQFSLSALKKSKAQIKEVNKQKSKYENQKSNDISLLLDLQTVKMQGKGVGYERWARRFNTDQLAKTMSFINENGLTSYKNLKMEADKIIDRQESLKGNIKVINSELQKVREQQEVIINYSKTKSVFEQYRKTGYSEKFKQEHLEDILQHRDAKKVFDEYNGSFPKMVDLKQKYAILNTEKNKMYSEINQLRKDNKELLIAFENVNLLFSEKYEEQSLNEVDKKINRRKNDER